MSMLQGRALPKFGEWDVNNPTSAEGFTVIFNKARNEKKKKETSGGGNAAPEPHRTNRGGLKPEPPKRMRKWFCCGSNGC